LVDLRQFAFLTRICFARKRGAMGKSEDEHGKKLHGFLSNRGRSSVSAKKKNSKGTDRKKKYLYLGGGERRPWPEEVVFCSENKKEAERRRWDRTVAIFEEGDYRGLESKGEEDKSSAVEKTGEDWRRKKKRVGICGEKRVTCRSKKREYSTPETSGGRIVWGGKELSL